MLWRVGRWFGDIFVVVVNCLIGEFNLLRLPQTCHEFFTRFLEVLRSRDVQDLFIEYLGSAEGQPLLRAHGVGLALIYGNNPLPMCMYVYI